MILEFKCQVKVWFESTTNVILKGLAWGYYKCQIQSPVAEINEAPDVDASLSRYARKVVQQPQYPDSCWAYDTPGIINHDQVRSLDIGRAAWLVNIMPSVGFTIF